MHNNLFISVNCRMRDAHFVLFTCLVLIQNFLVKFPRQQVSQMLGKHNLTLQDKIHVSIHLFSERKERGEKSLWREFGVRYFQERQAGKWSMFLASTSCVELLINWKYRPTFASPCSRRWESFLWYSSLSACRLGYMEYKFAELDPSQVWEMKGQGVSSCIFSCIKSPSSC